MVDVVGEGAGDVAALVRAIVRERGVGAVELPEAVLVPAAKVDLIGAGIKPGKQIGEILNALLALVLEDPQKNTKEYLMSYTLKNLFI